MAKKEKKEKGFMESVHDGYIRGSMGGEEETSQARTVTSPEPLPDEIKKFRKLYILVPISLIIGILKGDFTGWLAIAAFILLCLVCLIDTYADQPYFEIKTGCIFLKNSSDVTPAGSLNFILRSRLTLWSAYVSIMGN